MEQYHKGDKVRLMRLDKETAKAVDDCWDPFVGQEGVVDEEPDPAGNYIDVRFTGPEGANIFPALPSEIEKVT